MPAPDLPPVPGQLQSWSRDHEYKRHGTLSILATVDLHNAKHGSWLNLIETVSSRMARTFLKGIRAASREEVKQRILQGVRAMNLAPVVMRWKKLDLGLVNS